MIHIQPYMDILYHFMIHISELATIKTDDYEESIFFNFLFNLLGL